MWTIPTSIHLGMKHCWRMTSCLTTKTRGTCCCPWFNRIPRDAYHLTRHCTILIALGTDQADSKLCHHTVCIDESTRLKQKRWPCANEPVDNNTLWVSKVSDDSCQKANNVTIATWNRLLKPRYSSTATHRQITFSERSSWSQFRSVC